MEYENLKLNQAEKKLTVLMEENTNLIMANTGLIAENETLDKKVQGL